MIMKTLIRIMRIKWIGIKLRLSMKK